MKRKIMPLVLAMAVTFSFLVSCGSSTGQETENSQAEAASGTEEAAATAESTTQSPEEFSYPMETDATLTIWGDLNTVVSANFSSLNETPFAQGVIERTGITVEYQHPPTGQKSEQFSLIMADGNFPDIMEYNWLTGYPGGPAKALKDGVIIPLNDIMDKYCPNLKAYLEANPDVDKEVKTDDGIYYCFPRLKNNMASRVQTGVVLRTDWLEQAGLEVPRTIDDWHEVLTKFKEFTGGTAPMTTEDFFKANPFVYAYNIGPEYYVDENGKVQFGGISPEYKEFLTTFAQWYEEGLLDTDFASLTLDQVAAKMTSGQCGATFTRAGSRLGSWLQAGRESNPDFTLAAVPQPTKEALAEGEIPEYGYVETVFIGNGAAITTSCEDVEAAARFLDYGFSEEGHLYYTFGTEGVSYTMEGDYPAYTDLILQNPDGWTVGQAVAAYTRANVDAPVVEDPRYLEQYLVYDEQKEAPLIWAETNGTAHIMPPVTYTEDESREFATLNNEITSYQKEMTLKFIMGTESLDNYDEYVENLKRMGVERAVEIQQAAYDRYINR